MAEESCQEALEVTVNTVFVRGIKLCAYRETHCSKVYKNASSLCKSTLFAN